MLVLGNVEISKIESPCRCSKALVVFIVRIIIVAVRVIRIVVIIQILLRN